MTDPALPQEPPEPPMAVPGHYRAGQHFALGPMLFTLTMVTRHRMTAHCSSLPEKRRLSPTLKGAAFTLGGRSFRIVDVRRDSIIIEPYGFRMEWGEGDLSRTAIAQGEP